jgi:glycine hydroxymethyltransferase
MSENRGEMSVLKRTTLYETHRRFGARMAAFGGWEMPLWYSSAREEHLAVRSAAGLFDVTHMGVLELSGADACAFLDRLTTNDVSRLAIGRAQYSYILDDQGDVVDDVMIYNIAPQRYLMVVNAANDEKVQAWLRDHLSPAEDCRLRDLRAPEAGPERRVDLAVQGPHAREVLLALLDAPAQAADLQALPYTGVMAARLAGEDVLIARTGYTGERVAFELFVHPERAPALWDALLAAGHALGLRPCGLAARDSLRTEAGLPLYGHELAGPLNLAPCHIGFERFVKVEKATEFIGKPAYLQKAAQATAHLVRFRLQERGVRVAKLGDPVLDRRGRVIGTVTSCAQDGEGYLIGMALVEKAAQVAEGGTIYILALPERPPAPPAPFAPLGSRALMPEPAIVLPRFPPKRE